MERPQRTPQVNIGKQSDRLEGEKEHLQGKSIYVLQDQLLEGLLLLGEARVDQERSLGLVGPDPEQSAREVPILREYQ